MNNRSAYGHAFGLANQAVEGLKAAGAEVDLFRLPDYTDSDTLAKSGATPEVRAPILKVAEFTRDVAVEKLPTYDLIVPVVTGHYGNPSASWGLFFAGLGGIWASGALTGKVLTAISSTATQHGGQERVLSAVHTFGFHHGMVVVGLPYKVYAGQFGTEKYVDGSPYGGTFAAGSTGERLPNEDTAAMIAAQMGHAHGIADKLSK